jgi:hypothetical protein
LVVVVVVAGGEDGWRGMEILAPVVIPERTAVDPMRARD